MHTYILEIDICCGFIITSPLISGEALEMGSSINTALEVSTPGWWANIVLVASW